MTTLIQSRVVHPAFLQQQLRGESLLSDPNAPNPAPSSLFGHLRAQTTNEAGPPAANRDPLKHLLAHSKLMAGLLASVLRHPDTQASDIAVAARWVQAQVDALETRFQGMGLVLNGYQRHLAAQLFVHLAEQHPVLLQNPLPEPVLEALCTPTFVQGDAEEPPWHSLSLEADRELAWSRELAQVLATAQAHSFNRPPEQLLRKARQHLDVLAQCRFERLAETLGASQMVDPEAQNVVFQHALATSTRLYTACMARLSQDSVAAIARYEAAKARGDEETVDNIAWDYQERKLGYAHLLYHAQQAVDQLDQFLFPRPENPTSTPLQKPTLKPGPAV